MENEIPLPYQRTNIIGREGVELTLRQAMAEGALSHGWLIAGPNGSGKATLAYRLARALLDPASLTTAHTFDIEAESQVFKLVAARSHPDLFVAEREYDEKTSRYKTEIIIDKIRALIHFLNRTAAMGNARVAIIDLADDLNINAANAFLKALEEPPANCLLMLLSQTPGRLLPTIRSRCRRIDLRALDDELIVRLLEDEGFAKGAKARAIVRYARGRPGFAINLAAGEGAAIYALADEFLARARSNDDISNIAAELTKKDAEERWSVFKTAVSETLLSATRQGAINGKQSEHFQGLSPGQLQSAFESFTQLSGRGDALRIDRAQLIMALAHDLNAAMRAH